MFYIYLIQYLFNISEYKAMLIKLLIYHINIDVCIYIYVCVCVCVCVYVCMYVYIYIYIYIYIIKKVQIRTPSKYRIDKSNTVKTLTIPIPN